MENRNVIEFTKAFKASDGNAYFTIQEAQGAELEQLFRTLPAAIDAADLSAEVASFVVENSDKIVDILTTTESSRPKARKANGGTKKRQSKSTPVITASETAA